LKHEQTTHANSLFFKHYLAIKPLFIKKSYLQQAVIEIEFIYRKHRAFYFHGQLQTNDKIP